MLVGVEHDGHVPIPGGKPAMRQRFTGKKKKKKTGRPILCSAAPAAERPSWRRLRGAPARRGGLHSVVAFSMLVASVWIFPMAVWRHRIFPENRHFAMGEFNTRWTRHRAVAEPRER